MTALRVLLLVLRVTSFMAFQGPLNRLQQQLTSAQSVLILVPATASVDNLAAGLSLHLSLRASNKRSSLVTPQISEVTSTLVETEQLATQFTGKNLVISWPYPEDTVEQVVTEVDPQQHFFNIVIQSKPGTQPVDYRQLQFRYIGIDADVVVAIGGSYPDDFPQFQSELRELTDSDNRRVWSIRQQGRSDQSSITDPTASSLSEIMYYFLSQVKLPVTASAATNLLTGIEEATVNLTQGVTAETFVAMAGCMRSGGIRRTAASREGAVLSMPPASSKSEAQPNQPSSSAPSEDAPAEPATTPPSPRPDIPQPDWLVPNVMKR